MPAFGLGHAQQGSARRHWRLTASRRYPTAEQYQAQECMAQVGIWRRGELNVERPPVIRWITILACALQARWLTSGAAWRLP